MKGQEMKIMNIDDVFSFWVQKPTWAAVQRSLGRGVLWAEENYYWVKFKIFSLMTWLAISEAGCPIPCSKDFHYKCQLLSQGLTVVCLC